MGKKQTDEFLDWLASGGEEGQETLKHQMGRHNQQRHGWRYGDNLPENERIFDRKSMAIRIHDSGGGTGESEEYRRRLNNNAFSRDRASARARSDRRRREMRTGERPQPAQAAQATAAQVQAAIAKPAKPAKPAAKPAGVESQKKPKTLPPASGMRDMYGHKQHLVATGANQQFIDDLNLRNVHGANALVNRMFDTFEVYDKASGLSSKITSMDRVGMGGGEAHMKIYGEIRDKHGNLAGTFTRIISRRFNGQLEVHHDYFKLQSQYEGSGFGSRFVRHLEQKYKKMGVDKISLFANLDVGGYAWARMGFDFEGGYGLRVFKERAMQKWQQLYHTPMPARMASSIKHAWDVAAIRGPDGSNIGKMVMLGESWDAEKILKGSSLGYKVGEAYYDGK